MTKQLIRLFLKNPDPENAKTRFAAGRLSGIMGILCNLLLFAAKLLVGTLSGSVSITADAANNLSDAFSSIVTLIGFRLAEIPPDTNHPYGHARFEYLSGLVIAATIIVIGVELAKNSIGKIFHPAAVTFSWLTAVVLIVSILIKLWLCRFNGSLSRIIHSQALAATAADSRNDMIATAAVLLAALVETCTSWHIDGYIGLAVSIFILCSGAEFAKDTISPLLGERTSPELRQLIVDKIRATPDVLGFHDLMVHDYGPGQRFASIHVEMDHRQDPLLCHTIIDDLERECFESHGIHLVIHYDPVIVDDPELNRLKQVVLSNLQQIDSRLNIHDFRMAPSTGHCNLIFDISLPTDLVGQEKEIKNQLDTRMNQQETGQYYTVITFDPYAFNP